MRIPLLFLSLFYLAGCNTTGKPVSTDKPIKQTTEYTKLSGGELKPAQAAITLNHVDLSFSVYPKRKSIAGIAALTLVADKTLDKVVLDLDTVFDLHEVKVDGVTLDKTSYANPEGLLTINLPNPMQAGHKRVITIDYSGMPMEAENAPWQGGFVWAETEDGQPWIATAVQSEGCDLFWPCIDHPLREPQAVDIHVTVPSPLVAAANGRLMSVDKTGKFDTYHWRSTMPINTYAISLNIGPFELLEDNYQSRYGVEIPLQYWHLKENTEQAKVLFAEFAKVLTFFEAMIGPYPFSNEKMGVVETPHLGMEHQTINAYGNQYKVGSYGFDWLLHHEFAHEWFGNQLTHNNPDDMWLHEGFGTYMQPLYAQYLHGDLAYHAYLYNNRRLIFNRAPMVAGKSRTDKDLSDDGSSNDAYYKGSLFLHTLREFIGDETFFTATRELLYGTPDPKPGNFAPRNAGTKDFIELVNKHTGKDLSWLFHVYLYQKDLPELLTSRTDNEMTFAWKTEDDVPFPMPVEVSIDGQVHILDMVDGQGRIDVSAHSVVIPDPQAKVLRRQKHFEDWLKAGRKNRGRM